MSSLVGVESALLSWKSVGIRAWCSFARTVFVQGVRFLREEVGSIGEKEKPMSKILLSALRSFRGRDCWSVRPVPLSLAVALVSAPSGGEA